MPKKKIVYTNHAIVRRLERDIDEETIEMIINKPDYVKTTFDGRKIAVKKVKDIIINVVYIEDEKLIRIITVY